MDDDQILRLTHEAVLARRLPRTSPTSTPVNLPNSQNVGIGLGALGAAIAFVGFRSGERRCCCAVSEVNFVCYGRYTQGVRFAPHSFSQPPHLECWLDSQPSHELHLPGDSYGCEYTIVSRSSVKALAVPFPCLEP